MLAVPGNAWARNPAGRTVFYVAVGANLVLYQVDDKGLTLTRQTVTKVPEAIQYIWRHPVRNLIYVAYSNRFSTKHDDNHGVAAYRIDPQTGQLAAFKSPTRLANRPVNISLDPAGKYMLLAFNNPSELAIYRLAADGSIGALVKQPEPVDAGIYAHQVRVTPSGRLVVLCTRGNDPTATTHEDPGAIKVFQLTNGELRNEHSVANGNGLGFGPRHVDFHPTRPFMYVAMERNNQLLTYGVHNDGITPAPLFTKATVDHPELRAPTQYVGPIHVHPNGKFVYLANRSDGTTDFGGKQVYAGGENSVAVFAIRPAENQP
jgi:6-phosphogluconolactonase (cycloisomerase 2 family)